MREINKLVYIVLFLSSFQTSLAQSANVLLGNKYEKAESATSRSILYFSQKNSGSLNSTLEFNGKEINASASFTYLIDGSKVQITYEKDLGTVVFEFDGSASQLISPNMQGYVNGKWGKVIWTRVGGITTTGLSVEGNPNYTRNQEKIPVNSKTIVPAKIIGTSKKVGKLEVAQNDFSWRMDWNEAKNACEKLGEGWRLPTKDELDIIYKNRALIGGFGKLQPDYEQTFYWSSSLLADGNNNYYYIHLITEFHTTVMDKNEALSVRAVRTIL